MAFDLHPLLEKDISPRPGLWYVVAAGEEDDDGGAAPEPRVGAAAVQMEETGRVLLYAGANPEKAFSDVHILKIDSESISWKVLPSLSSSSPPPPPRYEHTLVRGPSDKNNFFVFAGGRESGALSDLWTLSPAGEWSEIGEGVRTGDPPPSPRTHHSSSCVWRERNEMIVFSGGDCGTNTTQDNSLYTFNMETYKWKKQETKEDPPPPRQGHILAVVDNALYVHGGMIEGGNINSDLFSLSLEAMTWCRPKLTGGVESPALAAHGCAVIGRCLYTFGGLSINGASDVLHFLDTVCMRWGLVEIEGTPPPARLDFAMTTITLNLSSSSSPSSLATSTDPPPPSSSSLPPPSSSSPPPPPPPSSFSPPPPPPSSSTCKPNLITVLVAEDNHDKLSINQTPSHPNPSHPKEDKNTNFATSEEIRTDKGEKTSEKVAKNGLKLTENDPEKDPNNDESQIRCTNNTGTKDTTAATVVTALLVYGGMDTSGNIHSDCFLFVPSSPSL